MLDSNIHRIRSIIWTLLISVILISTATIVPAVNSENATKIIEKSTIFLDEEIKDVVDFIEYVCENNTDNIYELFNEYTYSKDVKNQFDKYDINVFLSIVSYLKEEINKNKQNPMDFYYNFKNKEKGFFGVITDFKHEDYSEKNTFIIELIDSMRPFFKLQTEESSNDDNFEKYWANYSKAKTIWAGNIPRKNDIPSKDTVVPFKVWSGENFHEWYLNGCNFLFGLNDKQGESTFYLINMIGWYVVVSLFILCLFSGVWGIMGNSVEMAFMSAAMTGSFGLLASAALLYLDFYIMLYLMFGVNNFLNMFEWGNVQLLVQLKGDQEIIDTCTIEAYNENAYSKYGSDLWDDLDIPWSLDEFTYDLFEANNNENNAVYTICYPTYVPKDDDGTIHSQWKKAVPPPGNWMIRVFDQNENIIATQTIPNTAPRSSYFTTIEI